MVVVSLSFASSYCYYLNVRLTLNNLIAKSVYGHSKKKFKTNLRILSACEYERNGSCRDLRTLSAQKNGHCIDLNALKNIGFLQ